MPYTIEQVSEIIKAQHICGAPGVKILRLLTDSRSLSFPEETLFFSIVTASGDGHNYIDTLYKRGVRNFVVGKNFDSTAYEEANFLVVDDTLKALQTLAAHHRSTFDIPIVGQYSSLTSRQRTSRTLQSQPQTWVVQRERTHTQDISSAR